MKASSKRSRVESSSGAALPPPPSSSGDPIAKKYVDPMDPPPSTSSDSSIQIMLDTVMTVQTTHGQLLVDVLTKLQALRADLGSIW